jgi:PAS domain S-box-containing protein
MQNENRISEQSTDELSRMRKRVVELEKLAAEHEDTIETLTQCQEEYRVILDNTLDAVFLTDPTANGKILFANQEARRMFGFIEEEILEGDRDTIFDTGDPRLADMLKARERGETFRGDLTCKRKDGTLFPGEWSSSMFKDREGHPRAVTVVRDITERKRAEEALRQANKRYQTTMGSITDGFVSFDKKWRYTYINEAASRLLGYPREELIGRNPWEAFPESPHLAFYTQFTHACNKGTPVHFEEYYPAPLNRWFECHCYPEPEGLSVYFRDITDRKEIEEVLQRAHDELDLKVKERTAELSTAYETLKAETEERRRMEEQLQQAQKMEAIGTLSGGIAHDFNNILGGIIGFTEMVIEDTPPDNPSYHHLELILKSGLRARDLVRQILAFSRKTKQKREPVSLSPLVSETLKLLRASLPTTVRITVNIDVKSDTVLANPSELQQIIMNLSTNAAYAMKDAGGELEVTLAEREVTSGPIPAPGPYVELAVKDTGTGIDHAVMTRIFEPFFTTKEVGQGTGMGLSVVYGVVKSLNGDISVESAPGIGSTFRVLLPRIAEAVSHEVVHEIPRGKERILFVDDEEVLAILGKGVLERLGYRVTAITDSREALEVFSKTPSEFDLVLTDQTMPWIAGITLAQELLKIRADIPIILATGHTDSVSAEKANAMGIREYLMKPLARQELAIAVRRVLDAKARK